MLMTAKWNIMRTRVYDMFLAHRSILSSLNSYIIYSRKIKLHISQWLFNSPFKGLSYIRKTLKRKNDNRYTSSCITKLNYISRRKRKKASIKTSWGRIYYRYLLPFANYPKPSSLAHPWWLHISAIRW